MKNSVDRSGGSSGGSSGGGGGFVVTTHDIRLQVQRFPMTDEPPSWYDEAREASSNPTCSEVREWIGEFANEWVQQVCTRLRVEPGSSVAAIVFYSRGKDVRFVMSLPAGGYTSVLSARDVPGVCAECRINVGSVGAVGDA